MHVIATADVRTHILNSNPVHASSTRESFLPTPRKPRRYSQGSGCGGCDGGWSEARLWGGVEGALWRAADDDDRQITSLPSTLSRLDLRTTFAPPVSAQLSKECTFFDN